MGSKGGRPRKTGHRYPSGKLKPSGTSGSSSTKPHVAAITGTEYQRLIQNAKALLKDELLATQLGRLNRHGELSAPQTVAGFRIAEIYGAFERWHGVRRSARSPSYNASFGEGGIHEDLLSPEVIRAREESEARAIDAYKALEKHMVSLPREVRTAVEALCVEDQHIGPMILEPVRRFLSAMAQRWPDRTGSKMSRQASSRPADRQPSAPSGEAKPKPPRTNHDRAAMRKLLAVLRPDLGPEERDEVMAYYRGLRDLSVTRVKRPAREAELPKPVVSEAALKDRGTLTLPNKPE